VTELRCVRQSCLGHRGLLGPKRSGVHETGSTSGGHPYRLLALGFSGQKACFASRRAGAVCSPNARQSPGAPGGAHAGGVVFSSFLITASPYRASSSSGRPVAISHCDLVAPPLHGEVVTKRSECTCVQRGSVQLNRRYRIDLSNLAYKVG
jgi:hypothetical protein